MNPMTLHCPVCQSSFDWVANASSESARCPSCDSVVDVGHLTSVRAIETLAPEAESVRLEPGDRLAHFEIREFCGQGGFGSVYRAFDTRLERDVAIKIPHTSKEQPQVHLDSILREAQAVAQLSDPNIMAVFDVGHDQDTPYIVCDFVDGEALSQWAKKKQPTAVEAAQMIENIARAIDAAHKKRILHRDLKPSNILVKNDSPKIMDFGLALRDNSFSMINTPKGQVLGTPAYMSPEQALGKADEFDPRIDVYSCGVMLYELLASRRPFRGEKDLLIDEICSGRCEALRTVCPSLDRELERICNRAMAVDLDIRFPTALDLANELKKYIDQSRSTPQGSSFRSHIRTYRYEYVVLLVVILVAIGIGVLALISNTSKGQSTPSESAHSPIPQTPLASLENIDVEFSVFPKKAIVGVARVDFFNNKLDKSYNHAIEKLSVNRFRIKDAVPGWYIIEAWIPGFGIEEVWRYVPADANDFHTKESHSNWELAGTRVDIADVVIKPFETELSPSNLGAQQMIRIEGGTFSSEAPFFNLPRNIGSPKLLPGTFQPSFFIAKTETTISQYHWALNSLNQNSIENNQDDKSREISKKSREISKKSREISKETISRLEDDHPQTNVTFLNAIEYAEIIGGRLLTFNEYVFVASNGGTTNWPWGNQPEVVPFQLEEVGGVTIDQTRHPEPVWGLNSGAKEWIQDIRIAIYLKSRKLLNSPIYSKFFDSRMVVGGEDSTFGRSPVGENTRNGVFFFENANQFDRDRDVGFRVARSTRPRIIDTSLPHVVDLLKQFDDIEAE